MHLYRNYEAQMESFGLFYLLLLNMIQGSVVSQALLDGSRGKEHNSAEGSPFLLFQ
jgi:hypothetical protein